MEPRVRLAGTLLVGTALLMLTAGCSSSGDSGARLEEAPIESIEIVSRDSAPPRYSANIVAGLPGGCTSQGRHDMTRDGRTFNIRVLNTHTGADVCSAIYGTYRISVDLGSLQPGGEYTVNVNNETATFTAE
jgi:hypothetical protein